MHGQVWDPHHVTAVAALEKVQKLALKICTKNWAHNNYFSLLKQCKLPLLETRWLYLKLCYISTKWSMGVTFFQMHH